jgi:esterase/lipase superfamily enzyme
LFKVFVHRYNQEFSQESPRRNSKIVISGKIPTRPG